MATTHLRACDVPEARHELVAWADANAVKARAGDPGHIRFDGFEDPSSLPPAARAANLYYVNDDMTWLARTVGEGLPVCAFDADDLPADAGFLIWSEDPSPNDATVAQARAVMWLRSGLSLRVLVLDDSGPYRDKLDDPRSHPTWAWQVRSSMAGNLTLGYGARLPLSTETPWDQVKSTWSHGGDRDPSGHRYRLGADEANALNDDQVRILRTLLGTLLLIRQPADARRALHQAEEVRPDAAARKRLRRAASEQPDAKVRYYTLRQSVRPPGGADDNGAQETATKLYRHRWFVRPHRRNQWYPGAETHKRIWVGPWMVVPAGCEDAPILGAERVGVLRR